MPRLSHLALAAWSEAVTQQKEGRTGGRGAALISTRSISTACQAAAFAVLPHKLHLIDVNALCMIVMPHALVGASVSPACSSEFGARCLVSRKRAAPLDKVRPFSFALDRRCRCALHKRRSFDSGSIARQH